MEKKLVSCIFSFFKIASKAFFLRVIKLSITEKDFVTMLEKEGLLITSIFSVYNKTPLPRDCVYHFTHYHTMTQFDALKIYSCGNIVRKGEIACNKQFLVFLQCFEQYMALTFHLKWILKCCLQSVSI